jgi:hypothetical protein
MMGLFAALHESAFGPKRTSVVAPVCTENPIRIDWGRESPNVGAQ